MPPGCLYYRNAARPVGLSAIRGSPLNIARSTLFSALAVVIAASLAQPAVAQDSQDAHRRRPGGGAGGAGGPGAPQAGPQGSLQQQAIKPYDDVITKEAKSQQGVFKVHRVKDSVYWEIPEAMFHRVFLWQTEVAEVPDGFGYPGVAAGTHVVYFERRENTVFLREQHYDVRTQAKDGIATGVEATNVSPILAAFPIQAVASRSRWSSTSRGFSPATNSRFPSRILWAAPGSTYRDLTSTVSPRSQRTSRRARSSLSGARRRELRSSTTVSTFSQKSR